MKYLCKILLVLLLLAGCIFNASCKQASPGTALLQGAVTIGPIFPVEIPGDTRPVPPEVFSSRKIMIYDESGNNLLKEVVINQIGSTAHGYYAVQLEPGNYIIDINRTGSGGSSAVPRPITMTAGQPFIIDIDIDTGIR